MERTCVAWLALGVLSGVCLAGCGSEVDSARITYIDATDGPTGNTRLANGEVFIARGSPLIGDDNLWSRRPEGNGGSVFTTNDGRPSGPEDGPGLVTTVIGLEPGARYQVYAYFWTDQHDWQLKASLAEIAPPGDDPVVSFSKLGSPMSNPAPTAKAADFAGPPLLSEANRQLLQAEVGETAADANGRIRVWIDDRANTESSHRTWYDGIGVRRLASTQPPILVKSPLLVLAAVVIATAILYVFMSLVQNRRRVPVQRQES